jgi:hypothetical protein
VRQAGRAEEKLVSFRRQVAQRAEDSQHSVEALHNQLIEAESFRLQVKGRAERMEGEAKRLEQELDAENMALEQVMNFI